MEKLIAVIVALLINCAIVTFVIGLILGPHGARTRRVAGALFVLGLAPSIVLGLLRTGGLSLSDAMAEHPIATGLFLVALSVIAYGAIQLRRRSSADKPKRIQMKRPYTHRPDTDLLSMLREEIGRDA